MFNKKSIFLSASIMATMLFGLDKPLVLPDILKAESRVHHRDMIKPIFNRKGPTIQIGILLDTSNSMDGLINQAKAQLWKIVNEVAKANRDNKSVNIQVGLFEYGKSTLPYYEGYLQMLSPLTYDLDRVSEELFSIHTKGGNEYAGKVILEAVNRFSWSNNSNDLKLLIIAGNESFAQGDVPYQKAIQKAVNNGIIVNTIFCGNAIRGGLLEWSNGAKLGNGKAFNINSNDKIEYIATPYDDNIIELGTSLNSTYLEYGVKRVREAKMLNIYKQDKNSKELSKSSYIERNIVKSKKQYKQASSDMITAFIEDEKSINSISVEKLPDELQGKSRDEIKKIVESKKLKREEIQKEIKILENKRAKYLADKSSKDSKNLGEAIIKSIRIQAVEKGFVFEKSIIVNKDI